MITVITEAKCDRCGKTERKIGPEGLLPQSWSRTEYRDEFGYNYSKELCRLCTREHSDFFRNFAHAAVDAKPVNA